MLSCDSSARYRLSCHFLFDRCLQAKAFCKLAKQLNNSQWAIRVSHVWVNAHATQSIDITAMSYQDWLEGWLALQGRCSPEDTPWGSSAHAGKSWECEPSQRRIWIGGLPPLCSARHGSHFGTPSYLPICRQVRSEPPSWCGRLVQSGVKYAATYLYMNDVYVVRPKLP